MRSESALENLYFLLQFAAALLCGREFGHQAVVGNSILGAEMVASPLSAAGLVHERSEVLMPVQEIAVHAGPADDNPPVFPPEVGDCFENGCTLGG